MIEIDPNKTYTAYEIRKLGLMISPRYKIPIRAHTSIKNRLVMNGLFAAVNTRTKQIDYSVKGSDLIALNARAMEQGF